MTKSARDPFEPWFHQASEFWCKKIDGKVQYLSRDYRTAKKKLRILLEAKASGDSLNRDWLEAPFALLADEYLADVQSRRAPETYRNYREQLLRAMGIVGTGLRVADVRRIHLAKIEQRMTGKYSSATIRDTIAVMQQVYNWAVCNDLLDSSPLIGYQKPAVVGRTRVVTDEEFQTLLRFSDPSFRRFLIAMRQTGCRPGEIRTLTWSMVDLEQGLWILRKHKTVTMQREPMPRIIPLSETMLKMCVLLARAAQDQDAHVFTNQKGSAYTKDTVVRKMARIRKRAGIEKKNGESLVLYSNRHTFATSAVGSVSDTELAELMGHTTTRTLRRYVHLNADRLHEIRRRSQKES